MIGFQAHFCWVLCKGMRRVRILRLYGGASSLERTALSVHFPANREFNREIARNRASFSGWRPEHATQFTALNPILRPSGLEKSREFSEDIRELKFPVMGSSSDFFLLNLPTACREKRPQIPLHSRQIF